MNKIFLLNKIGFKMFLALPEEKKARKKAVNTKLFSAIMFLPLLFMMCGTFSSMTGIMFERSLSHELLSAVMLVAQIIIIMIALPTMISTLFFSKDNEFLATLPISSTTIYFSKMIIIYLSNLFIALVVVLPSFITIAVTAGVKSIAVGAEFYILGLVAIPLVPFLPMFLLSVLNMIMVWFSKFFKEPENFIAIILAILSIGLMILLSVSMLTANFSLSKGTNLLATQELIMSVLVTVNKIIYPNIFLSNAMVGVSIITNLSIYLAIVIGSGVVAILLSMFVYKKNFVRFLQIGRKTKFKDKQLKQNSCSKALMLRDFKTYMKEPVLLVNTILGIMFIPITIGLSIFVGRSDYPFEGLQAFLIMAFGIGVMIIYNQIASTAISREGKSFSIMRTLPISCENVIKSKRYFSNIYVVIASIIIGVTTAFSSLHWIGKIAVPINAILLGIAFSELMIDYDLKHPKLDWVDIGSILKGRYISLFSMLILVIESVPIILFSTFLKNIISQIAIELIQWGIVSLANCMLLVVFNSKLRNNQNNYFSLIE